MNIDIAELLRGLQQLFMTRVIRLDKDILAHIYQPIYVHIIEWGIRLLMDNSYIFLPKEIYQRMSKILTCSDILLWLCSSGTRTINIG